MGQRADYDSPEYQAHQMTGDLAETLKTEFSEKFSDGMKFRMIVSFHKYGPVALGYPERVDAIKSLEERLQRYRETGNAEWLIDVANFAMIEFMYPSHPQAHFRPTDSNESPGRRRLDGQDAFDRNRPKDSAIERLREKYMRGD